MQRRHEQRLRREVDHSQPGTEATSSSAERWARRSEGQPIPSKREQGATRNTWPVRPATGLKMRLVQRVEPIQMATPDPPRPQRGTCRTVHQQNQKEEDLAAGDGDLAARGTGNSPASPPSTIPTTTWPIAAAAGSRDRSYGEHDHSRAKRWWWSTNTPWRSDCSRPSEASAARSRDAFTERALSLPAQTAGGTG